jgi:gamma-glutamyltranspeptidase
MRVWMCLLMLWCLGHPALAQDRDYGRSMVVTDRGIVASSQVLASQAGSRILEQGGSAIDAAIAANAVLGVTEPMMNGIGGDLFLLYWDAKSGKLYGLNASGWAPQGLTIDFLKKQGITSMPDDDTIIPAFMERGDQHIGFGIMGGSNQPLAHAQFVSDIVDYGWNIQAALSAPRFTIRDTGEPIKCSIVLESRVSPEVQSQLRQKGHDLVLRKDYSAVMGRGQAVLRNSATGTHFATSDPRADGSAEPEAMPRE